MARGKTTDRTRGRAFPIIRLADRLRCPRCGFRKMSVMFDAPTVPKRNAAAVGLYRDWLYREGEE